MIKQRLYLLSQDSAVLEHWDQISNENFVTEKIKTLSDLSDFSEPQLVLMDESIIDWSESAWTKVFGLHRILVGSLKPTDTQGQKALLAGARAYVHAYSSVATLGQVLRHVQAGHVWVGESLLTRLISQVSSQLRMQQQWQSGLTPREVDVAQRAALGHSNQLIAEDLGITERTVRAHLSSVFEKLQVSDRLMLSLKVHGVG